MWYIKLSNEAEKFYHRKKIDPSLHERLRKAIDDLKTEMYWGPHIKRLRGKLEGLYRKDMGDYRIIYEIDKEHKTLYIVAIGPRGDIY